MPKTMYYSKRYNQRQQYQQPQQERQATAQAAAPVFTKTSRRSMGKMAPIIMFACLLLAIGSVALVPLLVGASAPVTSQTATSRIASEAQVANYSTVEDAAAAAGVSTNFLAGLPEGYVFTSARVVDGVIFELDLSGTAEVTLRCMAGTEDLSGVNYDTLTFTLNETVNDVTRCYAGVSDKKLTSAVWVNGEYTFALVSTNGVETALMKELAESMA